MPEHLLTEDIKNYLQRTMEPSELLKADDHLASCEACLRNVKNMSRATKAADFALLQTSPEISEHLSYEQLENYADEKSDTAEREIADVHLQVCDDCRAQLDGLLEMRELIQVDLQKQAVSAKRAEKSLAARLKDLFSGSALLRFGFAAAALLIVSLAIFWLTRRGDSGSSELVAASPPPNANSFAVPTVSVPANADTNAPQNTGTNLPNRVPAEDKREEFPPVYKAEIERALDAERLDFPAQLNGLRGQNGKLMGGGTDSVPFALESPLGKIIQTARPQFRWRALDGANGYVVNVYDANFNRVAGSSQIAATSWQIDRPLTRNKIYIWQVTALKEGQEIKSPVRPAPDAKFKVIDGVKASELERLSRQYKNEHLFLGILYANAGLTDEAAREFEKEIAQNPNSKLARKFLQDARRQR